MDYIDYVLNQYYNEMEISETMEKLGFKTYEEYADYLEDKEAEAQISAYEARMAY